MAAIAITSLLSGLDAAVVELAELASLAVELQPGLLRRLRRTFLPHSSPVLEAQLWASPLAAFRSASSLVLLPQALLELRARLALDQVRLDDARRIVKHDHAAISDALQCEEVLIYWGLVDLEKQPRAGIDEQVQRDAIRQALDAAVRSIVRDEPRRRGLLSWSTRALRTLPERVRSHERAGELALLAHAGSSFDGSTCSVLLTLPSADRKVRLSWTRDALRLSLDAAGNDRFLLIPDIEPYLVDVVSFRSDGSTGNDRLILPPSGEAILPLQDDTTALRIESLRRNSVYLRRHEDARAPHQAPFEFNNSWILVTGSVAARMNEFEHAAAEQTGRSLARRGCVLVTCGYDGVDRVASLAFMDELERLGIEAARANEYLVRVVHDRRHSDFAQGRLHTVVEADEEFRWPVLRAVAVVVIGWGEAIDSVVDHAVLAGVRAYAFPDTAASGREGTVCVPMAQGWTLQHTASELVAEALRQSAMQAAEWPGHALRQLAQQALVQGPAGWYFRVHDLADALTHEEPIAYGHTAAALASASMPERLIGLLAARAADIPSAEIVDALLKELDYARLWCEPRLVQEGLLTLAAHLRDGPESVDPKLDEVLRELHAFFDSNPHFDPSGYFRDIAATLKWQSETSSNSLEVFARRYESMRKQHPEGNYRTRLMNELLAEISAHAEKTGISDQRIADCFAAQTQGMRLVALGLCAGRPDVAPVDIVMRAIARPTTPFEQWAALGAARKIGELGPWQRRDALIAGIRLALHDENNLINDPADDSRRDAAAAIMTTAATGLGISQQAIAQTPRLLGLAVQGGQRWSGAGAPCVAVIGSDSSGDLDSLSSALGSCLAEYGWRIHTGYGARVGPALKRAFKRAGGTAIRVIGIGNEKNVKPPNQQFGTLADFHRSLISSVDCVLVVGGKKGTLAEAEYALRCSKLVVSLQTTGGSAQAIHARVTRSLAERGVPQALLAVLDQALPEDIAAERIVRILNIVYKIEKDRRN